MVEEEKKEEEKEGLLKSEQRGKRERMLKLELVSVALLSCSQFENVFISIVFEIFPVLFICILVLFDVRKDPSLFLSDSPQFISQFYVYL